MLNFSEESVETKKCRLFDEEKERRQKEKKQSVVDAKKARHILG